MVTRKGSFELLLLNNRPTDVYGRRFIGDKKKLHLVAFALKLSYFNQSNILQSNMSARNYLSSILNEKNQITLNVSMLNGSGQSIDHCGTPYKISNALLNETLTFCDMVAILKFWCFLIETICMQFSTK